MQVTVRIPINEANAVSRRTILLLSEDPDWRSAVERVLGEEGHRVLSARHPGQALVESMRHDGRIDLLVTDGDHGRQRCDFPARIFADHPRAKLLHFSARPRTREELVAAINATLG